LDGEDFILQVHRFFTRIRLGASWLASNGDARGSTDYSAAAVAQVDGWARSIPVAVTVGNGKP
jgi:hypothetical protein